ncbi:MAG: hypothetical protein NTX25_23320 [Proteobacteria bacterium]|nr:hypothetical protein [Pseudomonadota bacterium]
MVPSPPPVPGTAVQGEPGAPSKELAPPKTIKKQSYSKAEVQAECRKYEGQIIAYYDRVFKVDACKRHEVVSDDDEQHPLVKGRRIIPVESSTIAKIPEGTVIGSSPKGKKPNCASIEGRYVISRASDVFYVEKCKKRPFPDWDTYADHSAKHQKKGQEILELSEEEFLALPIGVEFKSSLDEEYSKMLVTEKSVDILPIDEACKGLTRTYHNHLFLSLLKHHAGFVHKMVCENL